MQLSNVSFRGPYAVTTVGRGGQSFIAGVGVFTYDGAGEFSGFNTFNVAGNSFGQRNLIKFPVEGTYAVDEDGTGMATQIFQKEFEGGFKVESDFVIMKAELIKGTYVAKEASFILRDVSPYTGNYITFGIKKLQTEAGFSVASFKGSYAYTADIEHPIREQFGRDRGRVRHTGVGLFVARR